MNNIDKSITVSIVSHGHGEMVINLINQLIKIEEINNVILTLNIPENLQLPTSSKLVLIKNSSVNGFGANHNYAFKNSNNRFFCVLNPDIILPDNPFPPLIDLINKYGADLVAPIVFNKYGNLEDSTRYFPTFLSLFKKLVLRGKKNEYNIYAINSKFSPEWVGGMFMFFDSTSFQKLNGFNTKYYLYYEDVDICTRLWKADMRLIVDSSIFIVHDARRASRSNCKHAYLHLKSMLLYLCTNAIYRPKVKLYGFL